MNAARKALREKFYLNPHGNISDIYESRGEVHHLIGNYDQALSDFSRNLFVSEKLKDEKREAKAIGQIGNVYLHQSDFEKEETRFHDSLALYRKNNGSEGMAYCYRQLGKTFQYKEKFQEASELFNKSLEIYNNLEEENGVNAVLLNIADNLISIEKYNEALKLIQGKLLLLTNKVNLIRAYQVCGKAMREMGNHEGSIEYFNKAFSLSREIGEKSSMVNILCDIGLEYYSRDDYPKAKKLFKECHNLAVQQNMTFMKVVALLNIGDVCHRMKDDREAMIYLDKVISQDVNIEGIKNEAKRLVEEIQFVLKGGEKR
jgi:tetratricopeptide (TPR) repeat protein